VAWGHPLSFLGEYASPDPAPQEMMIRNYNNFIFLLVFSSTLEGTLKEEKITFYCVFYGIMCLPHPITTPAAGRESSV